MDSGFEKARREFLEHMAGRNYSPTSMEHFGRALEPFFRFLEAKGIGNLREVGKETVKAYYLHLSELRTKKGEPFTWGTRSAYFRAVRRLFDWLERTRQVFLNPAQFIRESYRENRFPKAVLTREEVERIMAQPDPSTPVGFRDRTILEVFYSTGIRLNEMVNLKVVDVDLEQKLLRVNLGKGAKDRVVPLGETASLYVRKYMEGARARLVREAEEPKELWVSRWGRGMERQVLSMNVRYYAKKAGIQGKGSCHAFRHACATHMLREGAEIEAVSKLLGHKTPKVTQIYTHLAQVDVKKAHQETHPREKDEDLAAAVPVVAGCPKGLWLSPIDSHGGQP